MSSSVEIVVPDIGDFKDVEVIEVHVAAGDHVNKEDPLISLESDKATLDIPSTDGGVVTVLNINLGDKVSAGSPVLTLQLDDAVAPQQEPETKPVDSEPAPKPASAPSPPEPQKPAAIQQHTPPKTLPPPVEKAGDALPHASPGVRRFARELGADLSQVRGSGAKGRILKEDVQAYIKHTLSNPSQPAAGTGGIPPLPEVDFGKFGEIELQPLSRINKLSGTHLHTAWLNIPHVTHHDEADITDLEAFRQALKTQADAKGTRVTILAFIVKAVANAMKEFPRFNASLSSDKENLILKHYFHIGIAVDTPIGLMVPVLRDVDQKGIWQLAEEMGEISLRARDGKLKPDELQGGCMSISSLGGIGGTSFTPVVNAPEVAILGVSKSQYKPIWNGKEFRPRLMLPLDLSYDHRVIDGAQAARFAAYLSQLLSDAVRLVL
jgi:pyruvate dehydrogenase E2 component (dihydrolipoamide acetyltransferase)